MMHPEQQYIADSAKMLDITYKLIHHDLETITCKEKAALLGWPEWRIIKAIYLHPGDYSTLIGIVTPEIGRIDTQNILREVLQLPDSTKYTNGYLPTGMSRGTCTPFPSIPSMKEEIEKIIVIDYPKIDDELVDISIGDYVTDPFKTSMHLPYKAIFNILHQQFGDKIIKYRLRD